MRDSLFSQADQSAKSLKLWRHVEFRCHPVYNLFGALKCSKIININSQKPIIGDQLKDGLWHCTVE